MNARLAFKLLQGKRPPPKHRWPSLPRPIDAEETLIRSRAQSLLCGTKFKDGSS